MAKKNKNKKKKIVTLVSIIIFILLLLVTIGVMGVIISLGIIPLKYLIVILVVLGLLYFGFAKIIFNKKIRIWVKTLISIIISILIIGYLFGFYYLNSTLNFMDRIKADEYQIEKYYILTKKDSDIKQIEEGSRIERRMNNECHFDTSRLMGDILFLFANNQCVFARTQIGIVDFSIG